MARFLQKVLNAPEPLFSVGMAQLEKTAGYSGVDVRLIADMTQKAHDIMRRMGLDTRDSTGREIYLALIAAVRRGAGESLLGESDYILALSGDTVISFNLIDVINNAHHGLSYEDQSISHGQRSLRGELVGRYINHIRTDETTTRGIAESIGLIPERDARYGEPEGRQEQRKETTPRIDVLSRLLDAEEPIFGEAIQQLIDVSGRQSAAEDLARELTTKTRIAQEQLGLSPDTVTPREFYEALLARIAVDNDRLARLIGGQDSDDVRQMVPLMIKAANEVEFDRKVFVLKHSKAKEMLREMPPQKLMDRLGYSDVDALFDGEDFDEIYTALRFSEGDDWLNEYNELFKSVTVEDYEERDIRIIQMDQDKYVDLAEKFTKKKLHNVTHTKELGVIVVVPLREERSKGITLKTLPLLFHYLNEIQLYSNFFKLKSDESNFGQTVVETLIAELGSGQQRVGGYIHWRVIQRYFAKLKAEAPIEAFEPHVHPEDLHWRNAEELLYKIDPEMNFWKDLDYVGVEADEHPVTLNFIDISLSYANDIDYEHRYIYHFRESLWNEIFIRFMGYRNLESQVLAQLDNDMIAPEELTAA